MRLRDLAGAVDNALLDTSVVDDEALIIAAGTAHIAGRVTQHIPHSSGEHLYEGRGVADPCWLSGVAFAVLVAEAGDTARALIEQVEQLAAGGFPGLALYPAGGQRRGGADRVHGVWR